MGLNSGKQAATISELMSPGSVAVIGASEDRRKFGGRILHTLLKQGFKGKLYPINPVRDTVLGHKSYGSIAEIDAPVDLAIMAIPRDRIPQAVSDCGEAGVKGVIVVTAGFSETDEEGAQLEQEMLQRAREKNLRIIGPNCIGIISPAHEFVLCPTPVLLERAALRGHIGLVSQSGAIMGTTVDRATSHGIGFSHCISVGNQADLDLCDFVDFLLDDPATHVICTYIEGIKRPELFLATMRRAQQIGKPWLAIKAGRTAAGAAAAFSHTASLASDQAILEGLYDHYGIVPMDDIEAMLLAARGLVRYPTLALRSVAVLSPSGGGCTIAADRLTDLGIPLSRFSADTHAALDPLFPGALRNPVDIGAANDGASMSHTEAIHRAVLADDRVDLALTVLTAAPDITQFAAMAGQAIQASAKPSLTVLLPGDAADEARAAMKAAGVVYTNTLDTALRAISAWRTWTNRPTPETPQRPAGVPISIPPATRQLDEYQAKAALDAYGIQVNQGLRVHTPEDATAAARTLRGPYVVKIVSEDISHKTEAGGVALSLADAEAVGQAARDMQARINNQLPSARIDGFLIQEFVHGELELIMGLKRDDQFGISIMIGAGGILAELVNDVATAPCPLSRTAAEHMLRKLKIAPLFDGIRGGPALDIDAAAEALVRLSWLGYDWRNCLLELDVNPLLLMKHGSGCIAVDGRALLRPTA